MSALLWAFPALWLVLFAFPPVLRGRKAEHNPLAIRRPAGPVNPDGSTTAFAHLQEKGEFRLAKVGALVVGAAFFALPFDPALLMLQPIAMAAADQAVRFFPGTDYAGHGAEIIAAEAAGEAGYREAEIARMRTNRDKRGDDVVAQLARWNWLARIVFALGRW